MTETSLIGLGGFKQSGKDAVADHLVWHHGWRKSFMSEPLKRASEVLNVWINITEEEWQVLSRKHRVHLMGISHEGRGEFVRVADLISVLGYEGAKKIKEYRDHLQLLGTEVGRKIIDENAWINIAEREISRASGEGISTALTGIRFRNELGFIKSNGGVLIWVERPEARVTAQQDMHESEWTLGPDDFDIGIENTGTLEELYAKVDKIVEGL